MYHALTHMVGPLPLPLMVLYWHSYGFMSLLFTVSEFSCNEPTHDTMGIVVLPNNKLLMFVFV